jgi:hypothetical protein
VQAREREKTAFELRKGGASYAAIGENLGISQQAAYKCVKRVLENILADTKENVETVRQMEIERIDRMIMSIWSPATHGSLGAIDRVVKLSERRARLLGLDMPVKQDVSIQQKTNPKELTDDELAAIAAGDYPRAGGN